jgi:uridylate kinase
MPRKNRGTVVCLKQSGEALSSEKTGAPLDSEQVERTALRLQQTAANLARFDIALLVISGGGNIMRGDSFKSDHTGPTLTSRADGIARIGTVMNTVAIGHALADLGVPHRVLIADGMAVRDRSVNNVSPFSMNRASRAYHAGEVVLVAGGTGEDGCTTDSAVVKYALTHKKRGFDSRPYKATNVDGVYTADPRVDENAQLIPRITAAKALEMGISVVDRQSLEQLAAYQPKDGEPIGLRVYHRDIPLETVFESERVDKDPIGSLILSGLAAVC